jgi:hypothetical protein
MSVFHPKPTQTAQNFADNHEIVMLAGIKADLLRFKPIDPKDRQARKGGPN